MKHIISNATENVIRNNGLKQLEDKDWRKLEKLVWVGIGHPVFNITAQIWEHCYE